MKETRLPHTVLVCIAFGVALATLLLAGLGQEDNRDAPAADAPYPVASAEPAPSVVILSTIPGVNDLKDVQELLTGENLATGESLDWADRICSGVGVVIGSGGWFRLVGGARFLRWLKELGDDAFDAIKRTFKSKSPDGPNGPSNKSKGDAPTNPGGCFLAGTLVLTAAGPRPVEEIKSGDLVLSRSEETGEVGYKRVERTFPGGNVAVTKVTVASYVGRQAEDSASSDESDFTRSLVQEIRCTPDHPFFVLGRGWTRADDLRRGDRLVSPNRSPMAVLATETWSERAPTWNFQVADWRSYFVSGGPAHDFVWVHNTNPICPKGTISGKWGEFDYELVGDVLEVNAGIIREGAFNWTQMAIEAKVLAKKLGAKKGVVQSGPANTPEIQKLMEKLVAKGKATQKGKDLGGKPMYEIIFEVD